VTVAALVLAASAGVAEYERRILSNGGCDRR
jgi:hypothetical protein